MNAFKNTASTFFKERNIGDVSIFAAEKGENIWGWIDIDEMRINNGESLKTEFKYIQPDNANLDDQTVISVPLKDSIIPGQIVEIEVKFTTKLPKIFARTGYYRDYYLVGQWFPKIGVYEQEKNKWNCHQYHAHSEFFADFGVYNVDITVPENYIVGSSGVLTKEENKNNGTKKLYYKAEDVIDFAWTASPRFIEINRKCYNTNVKLLIQPEHRKHADRYFRSVTTAIKYFDEHIGEYPYGYLTIVDPPLFGMRSGGMEYPAFITGGSIAYMPKGFKFIEEVVIHEFGHQYFMATLASNEFEEPWLDEGLNTYMESRVMDEMYGEKKSNLDIFGIKIGNADLKRIGYINSSSKISQSNLKAWDYKHNDYGLMVYTKPMLFLKTLENILGQKVMDEILQKYYLKYKFKHPTTKDFIKIVNETASEKTSYENMDWFFEQVLYNSTTCDYELKSISNRIVKENIGTFEKGNQRIIKNVSETPNSKYQSKVTIFRNGELKMPIEVLIEFDDGKKELKYWDGKSRTKEFIFTGTKRIISAQIDPENKILLDTNIINNSKTLKTDTAGIWKYAAKFMFWLQNLMQSIAFFV
jgi:hypothetical protein